MSGCIPCFNKRFFCSKMWRCLRICQPWVQPASKRSTISTKANLSPTSWKTQQVALINRAKVRTDDLLLMVVAPIEQLVEAGGQHTRP